MTARRLSILLAAAALAARAAADRLPVSLLTTDGARIELVQYTTGTAAIEGTGTMRTEEGSTPFAGAVEPGRIAYAQVRDPRLLEWIVTGTALAAGVYLAYAGDRNETRVDAATARYYPSGGGGGGSCPLVYAWNGGAYELAAELFEDAFCRGMAKDDTDVLEGLVQEGGRCRLRVTNERPETHYLDRLSLAAVDVPRGVASCADPDGTLHTIAASVAPRCARDEAGRDVLPVVAARDGRWWESGAGVAAAALAGDVRDGVELEFARPAGVRTAKLVLRAGNSDLGLFAFRHLAALKGDRLLEWYRELDRDPAARRTMAEFTAREGGLRVSVREDGGWRVQAVLPNIGPELDKTQVAVLDLSRLAGGSVRVRLDSTAGLWRLDLAALDASPDLPLAPIAGRLARALADGRQDIRGLFGDADGRAWVTVRGQAADVEFDLPPPRPGLVRRFIVRSHGWYYRWFEPGERADEALFRAAATRPGLAARLLVPLWFATVRGGRAS